MESTTVQQSLIRRIIQRLFFRQGKNIFGVLSNRDFRNLWIGQMISFFGDALAINTLTLAIIRMANDADMQPGKILGALMVFSALPALFLGMIAGTIVDRSNRKRVMIASDIIRGVLALGYLLARDIDHVWIFIVVNVMLHAVSVFFFPARTAMLPQILNKQELLSANALAQLTHTISFVLGAAAAGVLVGAFGRTGPSFLLDSMTFFVSAYFIAKISISGKIERPPSAGDISASVPLVATVHTLRERFASASHALRNGLAELWIGLKYVFTDQVMRGILISFMAMFLGLGAANVTFVPLLINELGMPEEGLGVIRFSQTVGIIMGSAVVATSLAKRYRPGTLIGGSMVIFGVTTIIVSIVANYPLMIFVLFLVGLAIAPPQIVASTLMQRHVPGEKLGRASGAQGTIVNVANILSMGAAGLLMDEIGARLVFTFSGLLIFSAGFVSWWVLRDVKRVSEESSTEIPADAAPAEPAITAQVPIDAPPPPAEPVPVEVVPHQ